MKYGNLFRDLKTTILQIMVEYGVPFKSMVKTYIKPTWKL